MSVGHVSTAFLLFSLMFACTNAATNETISAKPTSSTVNSTSPTTSIGPAATPSTVGVPKFVFVCNAMHSVIIQAEMKLFVSYLGAESSRTKSLVIGADAAVDGACGNESETLKLQWSPDHSLIPFNLTLIAQKLPSSPSKIGGSFIRVITFEYFMSSDVFPETNKTGSVSVSVNGSFFETPGAMGFTCTSQQNISLNDDVIFGVSSLHLETFRNSNSTDFSEKALDCMDIPTTNKVVPIIVGVSAAILILLAILAFLIGNRRRAQGYQSL